MNQDKIVKLENGAYTIVSKRSQQNMTLFILFVYQCSYFSKVIR